MLGVMTIGNATLIALDDRPVLATDPWIGDEDAAYFGSWTLSHKIPSEQKALIQNAMYHWYSHGHPDHLNPYSIERYRTNKILLPDHVGGRIRHTLESKGYNVTVLPERRWVPLSKRIKVMCISDFIQDAILLIDVNGVLFLNINDAGVRACKRFIKTITHAYKDIYLLKLSGYGDADMINVFREGGERIRPTAYRRPAVGRQLSHSAKKLGANHVIPFSSFHMYQRTDSIWAEPYTTPISAYAEHFDHRVAEYVPPFVYVNCALSDIIELNPPVLPRQVRSPEEFGDSWSDDLDRNDRRRIDNYFYKKQLLKKSYGFIKFKVGNTTHTVVLGGPKNKGITFETPRNSLMAAVEYEIFDDLLIGNFMKTTFHNVHSLYAPNFTYVVAKYADNGLAQSREEVASYLKAYATRAKGEWLLQMFVERGAQLFRNYVNHDTGIYLFGKYVYQRVR